MVHFQVRVYTDDSVRGVAKTPIETVLLFRVGG